MKIALIVILAAPLAIVPAEAYPHHQITDAEGYDFLMTDEDPDGTEWCVKRGNGMTQDQIQAFYTSEDEHAKANPKRQPYGCLEARDEPGSEACLQWSRGMTQDQKDAWWADRDRHWNGAEEVEEMAAAAKAAAEDKRIEAANATCRGTENWKACGDNSGVLGSLAYGEIAVACEHATEAQARYDIKWPSWWLSNSTFHTSWGGNSALTTGKIIVFETGAKFQNMFGAMQQGVISCEYDFNTKTATVEISLNENLGLKQYRRIKLITCFKGIIPK